MNKKSLLNTVQMAEFAANGMLRFDRLVPSNLCKEMVDFIKPQKKFFVEFNNGQFPGPLYDSFDNESLIGRIFRIPKLRGALESLLGPNPRFDHHAFHLTPAHAKKYDDLHQDAAYDARQDRFDIQISIFPEDVSEKKGGTLFVPGTHFCRVHESLIRRYQNMKGQQQTVCKKGTVVLWHHNLWHSARSNHSDDDRYMYKIRLNPAGRQSLQWNTDDLQDPKAADLLRRAQHPWHGIQSRIAEFNKIKFWRFLTENPDFDYDSWMARVGK